MDNTTALTAAKAAIRNYYRNEYGDTYGDLDHESSFADLSRVPIAYTELGNENQYPVQVYADLVNPRLLYAMAGANDGMDDLAWPIVYEERYASLEDLTELGLKDADFDAYIEPFYDFLPDDNT